jgi:peroxiredoxin
MRTCLKLAVITLLMVVTISGLNYVHAAAPVKVGDAAPDFVLKDLAGKTVRLSDYRGKVVLLNFWGTFCPPCRAEMPSLNAIYQTMKDQGFVVLALSLDHSEGPVRSLVENTKLDFPVMIDVEKEVYYKKYATFALPLSYLIDKRGRIVETYYGQINWDSQEMRAKVKSLIQSQ